jgi:chorismate mutase
MASDCLPTFSRTTPHPYLEHIIRVDMRAYEPVDRALIDLRDQRTDLAIRIGLIKDRDQPDIIELFELRRELELLDHRIAPHAIALGA